MTTADERVAVRRDQHVVPDVFQHRSGCRIARIAHAEDDLELRVILLAAQERGVHTSRALCRYPKGYDYRPGRRRTARVRSSLAMTLTGVAGKTLN